MDLQTKVAYVLGRYFKVGYIPLVIPSLEGPDFSKILFK